MTASRVVSLYTLNRIEGTVLGSMHRLPLKSAVRDARGLVARGQVVALTPDNADPMPYFVAALVASA